MVGRREFLLGSAIATVSPKNPHNKKGRPMVWSNQAPDTITIPPGATSGQRIIIDQNSIRGYDTNNFLEFTIAPNSIGFTAGDQTHFPGVTISLDAANNPVTGQPNGEIVINFNDVSGHWKNGGISTVWDNPGAGGATERTHILFDSASAALDPGLAELELVSASQDTVTLKPEVRLNVFDTFTGNPTQGITVTPNQVTLGTPVGVGLASTVVVPTQNPIKIGSAQPMLQYWGAWRMPAQVLTTGIANDIANVTLETENNDTGLTPMNLATGVWTCPQTGIHSIHACIAMNTWVGTNRCALEILRNGTAIAVCDINTPTGQNCVSRELNLNKNDTITIRVFQGTGGNVTVTVGATSAFSIRRVL